MHYPNLLETNRDRLALDQAHIGALLGLSDNTIGAYERAGRSPGLQNALALELIFGRPISQLFPDTRLAVAERMVRPLQRLSIEFEHDERLGAEVRRRFVHDLGNRIINLVSDL